MNRFKIALALIFITLFVVMPLYELADYGEHWPHDGEYVSMALAGFFVIGLARICRTLVAIASIATSIRDAPVLTVVRPATFRSDRVSIHEAPLFLTLCDLRV